MGKLWSGLQAIVDSTVRHLGADQFFTLFLSPQSHEKSRVRKAYEYFLKQTYTYVINTHPILATAEQTFAAHEHAFFRDVLRARIEAQAKEEARHETWLVNDYVAMGNLPEDILDAKPNSAIFSYNAYVSFLATSPQEVSAIFGVSTVLDGIAIHLGRPMAEKLTPIFGKDTVSFIWRRGATDKKHLEELAKICDQIEGIGIIRSAQDIEADSFRMLLAASVVSQLYRNMMSLCKL